MEISTLLYWFIVFLLFFSIVPALFGFEFGSRRMYIALLYKIFAWGTKRIEQEEENQNDGLHKSNSDINLIEKENPINQLRIGSLDLSQDVHKKFEILDVTYFVKSGIEAVIDDEVTKRFSAEELPSWNLLTRSNGPQGFISFRLSLLWLIGVLLRYCILLPGRLIVTTVALIWTAVTIAIVAYMPESNIKRRLGYHVNVTAFRMLCRACSAIITYHDRENMPRESGICVANHTTVLDAAILMQDRPYAILGQVHGGFLGWLMRTMAKATKHVWFERSEVRDRQFVSKRIYEHVSEPGNYPILLFPEGTCINNTSVMMFKKGSFEIPTTIYPVAIKYNPWFGDAFWNSSKHSMIQYLLVIMTSWAIVADVWYLPAMTKEKGESALKFAERVKSVIARRGGLVDCVWDGQLKRMRVKDSYLLEKQKQLGEFFSEENWEGEDGENDDEETPPRHDDHGDSTEVSTTKQDDANEEQGVTFKIDSKGDSDKDSVELSSTAAAEQVVTVAGVDSTTRSGETTLHHRTPVLTTS